MDELEPNEPGVTNPAARGDIVVGVLNAIAILLAIAWLWIMIRGQQNSDHVSFSYDGEPGDTSFAQRIDIALQSIVVLAYAAVVGGIAQIVSLLSPRRDASSSPERPG
jgi:hypothetical protein